MLKEESANIKEIKHIHRSTRYNIVRGLLNIK
jgi:hypothetical protein